MAVTLSFKTLTHTEAKSPRISVSRLADFMAASEQARRSIIQSCKFRPIAKILQHNEAAAVLTNAFNGSGIDSNYILRQAEQIAARVSPDPFVNELNLHNADMLNAVIATLDHVSLPAAEYINDMAYPSTNFNGVQIAFRPLATLQRVTRTNKTKIGTVHARYRKVQPISNKSLEYQSAFQFGYLKDWVPDDAEPDKALCLTVDIKRQVIVSAPGNSTYMFNEMRAACATIAERWPAIKPPQNARLA